MLIVKNMFILLMGVMFLSSSFQNELFLNFKSTNENEFISCATNIKIIKQDSVLYEFDYIEECYITIFGLPYGKYVVAYENPFDQKIEKKISIINRKTKIDLFYDGVVDDNKLILPNLKEGDTLMYRSYGYGCEPYYGGTFTISVKDGKYFASLFKDGLSSKSYLVKNKLMEKLIATEKNIIALGDRGSGGCTMTILYQVILNGETMYQSVEGSCRWIGFSNEFSRMFKINNHAKFRF